MISLLWRKLQEHTISSVMEHAVDRASRRYAQLSSVNSKFCSSVVFKYGLSLFCTKSEGKLGKLGKLGWAWGRC